jgi:hypothetical protein
MMGYRHRPDSPVSRVLRPSGLTDRQIRRIRRTDPLRRLRWAIVVGAWAVIAGLILAAFDIIRAALQ